MIELGGRDVERKGHVGARLEAGRLDRGQDQVQRRLGARDIGGETALVAETGGQPLLLEHRLQRVVHLGAPAQGLLEGRRTDRRDHELLDVDAGVGVCAAVEDVHHRHRQDVRVRTADVAEQRQRRRVRRGLGHGERNAEDGVGAEPGLVRGAVKVQQRLVDQPLVVGAQPDDRGSDLVEHGLHRLVDALAAVTRAAVAQLHRLVFTGGRARRHRGAGERAVRQGHLDLDRRVAAGIEDLAGSDLLDDGHWRSPWSR